MSIKRIVTIGYEGADQADFLATLDAIGVNVLLDVRELAISRRKGFAKNALREGLASIGVDYRHEPRLGSPKDVRHQLREDGDLSSFFKRFDRYLASQQDLLKELAEDLDGTVALLCFERDHTTCHRRSVAAALHEITGIAPKHHGVQPHGKCIDRSRKDSRQGVPAS